MANRNPPLENLKPFVKGQSGNPKGGSASRSIEKIFRDFLFEQAKSKDGQTRQRLEVLMARMFSDGAQGNVRSIETLLAYGFGKPTQKSEISGTDGGPLNIVVGFTDAPSRD